MGGGVPQPGLMGEGGVLQQGPMGYLRWGPPGGMGYPQQGCPRVPAQPGHDGGGGVSQDGVAPGLE